MQVIKLKVIALFAKLILYFSTHFVMFHAHVSLCHACFRVMFCNTDACNQKRISWSKPVITSVELNQDNREKLRSYIDTFIVDEFEPVNTASSDRSNDQFNLPCDTNERNRMSYNVNT